MVVYLRPLQHILGNGSAAGSDLEQLQAGPAIHFVDDALAYILVVQKMLTEALFKRVWLLRATALLLVEHYAKLAG
jgi:hypothetical protein